MKFFRRFALLIAVATLATVVAMPASAAVDSTTKSKIQSFPYLYNGVDYPSAVRALQKFLIHCNVATQDIKGDGLDGGFGNHVEAAVRIYQVTRGIGEPGEDPNNPNGTGEVSTRTWGAIADDLFDAENDGSPIVMRIANDSDATRIYRADVSSSGYHFAYYDEYDSAVFWIWK